MALKQASALSFNTDETLPTFLNPILPHCFHLRSPLIYAQLSQLQHPLLYLPPGWAGESCPTTSEIGFFYRTTQTLLIKFSLLQTYKLHPPKMFLFINQQQGRVWHRLKEPRRIHICPSNMRTRMQVSWMKQSNPRF